MIVGAGPIPHVATDGTRVWLDRETSRELVDVCIAAIRAAGLDVGHVRSVEFDGEQQPLIDTLQRVQR